MRVGERIAERRRERGLSQTRLARNAGLSQGTIGKLEAGLSSGSSHLHRIAAALGTTPAYLVGETNDPDEGAPVGPDLDSETLELVDRFATLAPADRRALLQVARSMADGPQAHGAVHAPRPDYAPKVEQP